MINALNLTIRIEKRDDKFVVRTTPIPTTCYAPDVGSAVMRALEAVHLVVKAVADSGGDAEVEQYLSKMQEPSHSNGKRYEFRTLHVAGDFNNFDAEMSKLADEDWEPFHYMLVNNQMTAVVICRRERHAS